MKKGKYAKHGFAAKALILEADELDQPTLDALMALLTEAGEVPEG